MMGCHCGATTTKRNSVVAVALCCRVVEVDTERLLEVVDCRAGMGSRAVHIIPLARYLTTAIMEAQ
jgi:hypothetical protein